MPVLEDPETAPSAAERGRADLAAWMDGQPTDFYADDTDFQALVAWHGLQGREDRLHEAGAVAAGPLDDAVRENNLHHNLPRLDLWDGVGRLTSRVSHHPSWQRAGELIYGTGVMAAYAEQPTPHRYILSLFYLTSHCGEAGHNCPLACDAGAIRCLQALGTPEQQRRYLQPLLDPDFRTNFTASQFLTEVQGGSDVGANAVVAVPRSERRDGGSPWSISGEKWFCSNADADVFIMTARVGPPDTGTGGLGLFLVPRHLPDGSLNGFRIRRLKDKLGTRSMASGEVDFQDAHAEALGPVDQGFRNVIERVINTSRLYNAFSTAGIARRSWVVASTYARHRRAFGQPIGAFTQVQETLAWMRADAAAMLASSLWLAGLFEDADAGDLGTREAAFLRVAVNLNKMRTSVLSHDCANRGIEVLGGNGAIESFSVLPRLLHDNVVCENWEGTHNVLRAQVLRDCSRRSFHHGFFDVLRERLEETHGAELDADQAEMEDILATIAHRAKAPLAELRFRRLADRMATWTMVAAMAPLTELDAARPSPCGTSASCPWTRPTWRRCGRCSGAEAV